MFTLMIIWLYLGRNLFWESCQRIKRAYLLLLVLKKKVFLSKIHFFPVLLKDPRTNWSTRLRVDILATLFISQCQQFQEIITPFHFLAYYLCFTHYLVGIIWLLRRILHRFVQITRRPIDSMIYLFELHCFDLKQIHQTAVSFNEVTYEVLKLELTWGLVIIWAKLLRNRLERFQIIGVEKSINILGHLLGEGEGRWTTWDI